MTLDDIDVTEWTTPELVRQFAEIKVASALRRRVMDIRPGHFQWVAIPSYKFLSLVVTELRARGVLDMH